tara:strand:- start:193 stop:708 length:516 start_codon:yes stop_codon:yes gene_type:complete
MNNKTQPLTPTAIARLRELIEFMQENEPLVDMSVGLTIDTDEKLSAEDIPSCGTVACIAGWMCVLNQRHLPQPFTFVALNGEHSWLDVWTNASSLLELDVDSPRLRHLFFIDAWPSDWYDNYMHTENDADRRRVVTEFLTEICDQGYFQTVDEDNDDDEEEEEEDADHAER